MVYLEVKNFDSTFAILPWDCGDAVLLPRTKLDAAISGIFSVRKVSWR